MPGVVRPYTLTDVLATINQQNNGSGNGTTTISGLGDFAEADESAVLLADSAITATPTPASVGWDLSEWGIFNWQ